ncbi:MAG: type II toxin-antitoxin system RelE/ParE family toxin [Clostridiales bacterium]|nr:type II toxin-antitoxin system RelE/ParE family toxin [Clostridiales bacterium]
MDIKLSKQAKKYLDKCDGKTYNRLKKAIDRLANFDGDIEKLKGFKDKYRLKKPPYRILFRYTIGNDFIYVEGIHPRGDAYKKGRSR